MTDLSKFVARNRPQRIALIGRYVSVMPLDWDVHSADLEDAITGPDNADLWTYVPLGPFETIETCKAVMSCVGEQKDWEITAIVPHTSGKAAGMMSYMRLRPEFGSAEVGCVIFGQSLQKTREATEALYLMACHLFDDLGYRRFEWKCENANEASKRAAERFGFTFEGIFRNDRIVKGRNRDTAWFSIIDSEWPALKAKYETWLSPENFDDDGQQRKRLQDCKGVSV